ncbi:hypothetical protein BH20BAC1_BH20BAC1_16770 [soil metagenome]
MTTTQLFDLSGNVAVITGGNGGIGRVLQLVWQMQVPLLQ